MGVMGRFRALHDLTREERDDDNRRRAGRIAIESIRNSEGDVFDLSCTGARIQTRRKWKVGEIHPVVFQSEDDAPALALEARCVWVRKVSMFQRMVGLEFVDLTPEKQKILSGLATRSAKRAWGGGMRHSNDVDWDRLEALERAASKTPNRPNSPGPRGAEDPLDHAA